MVPVHVHAPAEEALTYLDQAKPFCVLYHSAAQRMIDLAAKRLQDTSFVCIDSGAINADRECLSGRVTLLDWGGVCEESTRPVYLRCTSGTTGHPKLVVDDIRAFSASFEVVRRMAICSWSMAPVFLAAAPLSHACGVFAFVMLTQGAPIVPIARFDPSEVWQAIDTYAATHLWLPPSALYLMLDSLPTSGPRRTTLRHVMLGAAGVSPRRICDAVSRLGPIVSINYSQIESGFLTWLSPDVVGAAVAKGDLQRLQSAGQSLGVARLATMDDGGLVLPAGGIGEIVARGPSVRRYLDEGETQFARRHGWHHTGDVGYFDAEGNLFVTGRLKDVINCGGFKVLAQDVEEVIRSTADVIDCAVVAVPDEFSGEAIAAVVVARPGVSVPTGTLIANCVSRLGPGRAPKRVEYWSRLPLTTVGKVDKQEIRSRLLRPTPNQSSLEMHPLAPM